MRDRRRLLERHGAVAPTGQAAGPHPRSAPPSPIQEKGRGVAPPRKLIPADPPHPYPAPRSARPRGLSRGVVRPGGVAVFMAGAVAGPDHGGAARRRGLQQSRSWPTLIGDGRNRKTTARGVGWCLSALPRHRHSTSTSARSRRLRRHQAPRIPLDMHLEDPKPSRREPAGISVRHGYDDRKL